MPAMESNPFAILTFIAAPAVLTNASSVLALGTSNRFARNVDRARQLIQLLETKTDLPDSERDLFRHLLVLVERRSRLLMWAMSCFYFSIGSFAAGVLMSLLGAMVAGTEQHLFLRPILIVALITGFAGLAGLITGGALLVSETRLALRSINEEASYFRSRYKS